MKKLFLTAVLILAGIFLISCDKNKDVTATLSIQEKTATTIKFDVVVNDPKDQITGEVKIVLFSNGTEYTSKSFDSFEDDIEDGKFEGELNFTGLTDTNSYSARLVANISKRNVTLDTVDFSLSVDEVIEIRTPEEFISKLVTVNATYEIMNDLDFTDIEYDIRFKSGTPFAGQIIGNGHTLSNIKIISKNVKSYTGLIGYLGKGTINDLVIENMTIGTEEEPVATVASASRFAFVVANSNDSKGVISNVTVKNSRMYIESKSTTSLKVGGIMGYAYGTIRDCSVIDSQITIDQRSYGAHSIGGVVGHALGDAQLVNLYTDVDITYTLIKVKLDNNGNEVSYSKFTDKTINLFLGGIIGQSEGRANYLNMVNKNWFAVGDINIPYLNLAINNPDGKDYKPANNIYVGGVAGRLVTEVKNYFYGGNINFDYEAKEDDEISNKVFRIGGLMGAYLGEVTSATYGLRYATNNSIEVNYDTEVAKLLCQVSETIVNVSFPNSTYYLYGDSTITINEVASPDLDSIKVDSTVNFFDEEEGVTIMHDWLEEYLS